MNITKKEHILSILPSLYLKTNSIDEKENENNQYISPSNKIKIQEKYGSSISQSNRSKDKEDKRNSKKHYSYFKNSIISKTNKTKENNIKINLDESDDNINKNNKFSERKHDYNNSKNIQLTSGRPQLNLMSNRTEVLNTEKNLVNVDSRIVKKDLKKMNEIEAKLITENNILKWKQLADISQIKINDVSKIVKFIMGLII